MLERLIKEIENAASDIECTEPKASYNDCLNAVCKYFITKAENLPCEPSKRQEVISIMEDERRGEYEHRKEF